MVFSAVLAALAATAATVVKAQDPGSLGITPCILACITPAAQANNCSSFADIPCVCGSAQLQVDARACLADHCEPAELETAVSLQSAQCASITPSGTAGPPQSLSFTSPTQPTAGSSTTGSSTTPPGGVSTTAPPTSETSPAGNSAAVNSQRVGWAGLAVFGAVAGLAL
ncbi:hypothetical protein H1R20_g12169, partial [Candolleomyces eurysporus]